MSREIEKGRPTTRRKLDGPEGRKWLGNLTEVNLRRLWLLTQYQTYDANVDFAGAVRSLKNTFKSENKVTGTYWSTPNRRQVLGRLRELKVDEFINYWEAIKENYGIDIFTFAAHSPTELLFEENHIFIPLSDASVKVPLVNFADASLDIPLPDRIEKELKSASSQEDNIIF